MRAATAVAKSLASVRVYDSAYRGTSFLSTTPTPILTPSNSLTSLAMACIYLIYVRRCFVPTSLRSDRSTHFTLTIFSAASNPTPTTTRLRLLRWPTPLATDLQETFKERSVAPWEEETATPVQDTLTKVSAPPNNVRTERSADSARPAVAAVPIGSENQGKVMQQMRNKSG